MNRIDKGLRNWHESNPIASAIVLGLVCLVALSLMAMSLPNYPAFRALYIFPIWIGTRLGGRVVGFVVVGLSSIANVLLDMKEAGGVRDVLSGFVWFAVFTVVMLLVAKVEGAVLDSERLAHQDPLTGLTNRRGLEISGRRLIDKAIAEKKEVAVVVIDCDRFKQINDDFGHRAGDDTLRFLARTLEINTRETDIVARLGGDEFVLVLADTNQLQAVSVLQRIQDAFEAGMTERGFGATLSVGIAGLAPDAADLRTLVSRADIAMYQRKEAKQFDRTG